MQTNNDVFSISVLLVLMFISALVMLIGIHLISSSSIMCQALGIVLGIFGALWLLGNLITLISEEY